MGQIFKLAEEAIGVYLIGHRIADSKYSLIRKIMLEESSKMISSALSMILFGTGLIILMMFVFLFLGYGASKYFEIESLIFAVPLLFTLIYLCILWIFRKVLFKSIFQKIIKDII